MTDRVRRLAALGLAGLALAAPAAAQGIGAAGAAPGRFSSVAVDASVLRARGAGITADRVSTALEADLRREFADRLGSGGPRLVVHLTAVSMNAFAGSDGPRGLGNGTNSDYLEGEALVVGPRGEVIARYPQLSVVPASSGGAWYLPGAESNRAVALANHFGGWLRRRIP